MKNMPRVSPYLGIAAALLFGVFLFVASRAVTLLISPEVVPAALPAAVPAEPPQVAAPTPAPVDLAATKIVAPAPSVAPAPRKKVSMDAAGVTLLKSLVNIICYAPQGSGLHSMSASGVIVDPKGYILTNAHVAQYYLLESRGVSCSIRSGNPAVDRYKAGLAYISPLWVTANQTELIDPNPVGTGQYDFALLAITESAAGAALPSPLPFVPLAEAAPMPSDPVVVASYGAQTHKTEQIQSNLAPSLDVGSVKDIFTFGSETIDVLSLSGSPVAEEGSSGGGVADAAGTLVATITTSAADGPSGKSSLHAITASYIRAAYTAETGEPLDALLSREPQAAVASFVPRVAPLASFLTQHLP